MQFLYLSEQLTRISQCLFSCKDTAQQFLMSACPSVCLWSTWKSTFLHPSTKSRMLQNAYRSMSLHAGPWACMQLHNLAYSFKMSQNVQECSRMHAECSRMHSECCRMHAESSRMSQNVPECMQNVPECMQFVQECMQYVPECMQIHELACNYISLHAVT